MDIFIALILKLLPLYFVMLCGFALSRKTESFGHSVSYIQINLIAPVVIALNISTLDMKLNFMILPLLFLVLCSIMGIMLFGLGRKVWPHDNTGNLMAYATASGNTGYFGVPVALLLFPEHTLGLFMLAMVGVQLYDNTLGYYFMARGHHTVGDSLLRLLRLPPLYGCIIGLLLSAFHIRIPDIIMNMGHDFRSTYVILGALMIGFGLSHIKSFNIDLVFLGLSLAAKFIVFPAVIFGLIMLDRSLFHLFNEQIYGMMFLLAIVPLPANAVAFAILLNVQPQKAALAVFVSTVVALFYIPAILVYLGFI